MANRFQNNENHYHILESCWRVKYQVLRLMIKF